MPLIRKITTTMHYALLLLPSITSVYAEDINIPKTCQSPSQDFNQTLECAKKYFILNGEPINPLIIRDLGTWVSDRGDQVVAINLRDSQNSNKYYFDAKDYKKEKYGKYFSAQVNLEKDGKAFFKYAVEGVTKNGVYVLQTWENQGGSGTFSNLLFVRLRQDMGFSDVENEKLALNRKRILMEKLGDYGLGDRVVSNIKVEGNTIVINTEEQSGEKATQKFTISFEDKR